MAQPAWFRREIIHDPRSEFDTSAVEHVQRVLRADITGRMDEQTRGKIRGLQVLFRLNVTGTINQQVADTLDRIIPSGALSEAN